MYLNESEQHAINARVRHVETRTGVQVVTAIVGKSDSYAELPWKAFALGTAIAGLAVVATAVIRPGWVTAHTVLVSTTVMLGAGVALALAAVAMPWFARLFLTAVRRDVEVRQQAQSLFLAHELFRTRARTGVLVLVSLFEHAVEILPDTGLRGRVSDADWSGVVARLTSGLGAGQPAQALMDGLEAVEDLLAARGFEPTADGNELPDRPIEERGV